MLTIQLIRVRTIGFLNFLAFSLLGTSVKKPLLSLFLTWDEGVDSELSELSVRFRLPFVCRSSDETWLEARELARELVDSPQSFLLLFSEKESVRNPVVGYLLSEFVK